MRININLYNSSVLKLDNYIINQIGLVKNKCFLKLDEYQIYCVPFELSYDEIKLISILNRNEVDFFSKYINTLQSISLTFVNTPIGKEIPIFMRINITSFELKDEVKKQCYITAKIKRPSDDYKELLAIQFDKIENAKKLYEDEVKSKIKITFDTIRKSKLNYELFYKFDNNIFRGKLIEASLKEIKIFGELFEEDKNKENIIIEMFTKKSNFFIKGKIIKKEESKEVQGFYIITIELPFSYPFINSLTEQLDENITT